MTSALARLGPMIVQLGIATLALLALAMAPPAAGRMLLVPLDGELISEATIRGAEATPLVRGPLPGSWVVDGNREQLSALWAQQVLVLAAPAALCSSVDTGGVS